MALLAVMWASCITFKLLFVCLPAARLLGYLPSCGVNSQLSAVTLTLTLTLNLVPNTALPTDPDANPYPKPMTMTLSLLLPPTLTPAAVDEMAAPDQHPDTHRAWQYINIILTDSQIFVPIMDLVRRNVDKSSNFIFNQFL